MLRHRGGWISAVAFATLTGCGGDRAGKAPQHDSVPVSSDSTIRTPPAAPVPPAPDSVVAHARRAAGDSAIHLALTSRIAGRGQSDSISLVAAIRSGLRHPGWRSPTVDALPGALLPARRIVAFYGNPLSGRMGILGELPPDQMLARLDQLVAEWQAADPTTPVQPALQLVTVVAQGRPGKDRLYRLRMDTTLIQRVYGWAQRKHAILILDIQAGHSGMEKELSWLLPWLARPDVHLAMDPEFYMHYNREGRAPGTRIGAMDASDVNYAIGELAKLVTEYHLPPKVLIVHRFTRNMLQNAEKIRLDPRVQVVINMDGWGPPWHKFDTYALAEIAEPVQFTGFKLFFHNDTRKGDSLLTPREVLSLRPRPVYIQYQ